jgi:predicted MFS family arabinose efflux permease
VSSRGGLAGGAAPCARSLVGLDIVNVFMADVKDGVGVYLSVYLLTEHRWEPSRIGIVVAIPWVVSILAQSPVGAFIDVTRKKRLLLVVASAIVALSCITVVLFPAFLPIAASQVALGVVQTVFPPTVAAITLGIVGHERLAKRIGRNESFNHGGNMLAAVVAVFIGWYISYEGIFYFSVFQCAAIIVATLMIREKDIDHDLARSSDTHDAPRAPTLKDVKELFADRNILHFTVAVGLWNVANGAMLPMLGQKLGITSAGHSALYLSICIIIAQAVMVVVAPAAAKRADGGRKGLLLVAFVLVPVRAVLFALLHDKYALVPLQIVDGIGAGIYGVVLILMMADLSKGTGHFNLLQGTVYAAVGLGVALSSVIAGFVVTYAGYTQSFLILASIGVVGTIYCWRSLRETAATGAARPLSVRATPRAD